MLSKSETYSCTNDSEQAANVHALKHSADHSETTTQAHQKSPGLQHEEVNSSETAANLTQKPQHTTASIDMLNKES